jgi:hypothetical protein
MVVDRFRFATDDKLCYDFLNKGECERVSRGNVCKFRHVPLDHPQAIAARPHLLQNKVQFGNLPRAAAKKDLRYVPTCFVPAHIPRFRGCFSLM